MDIVRRVLQAEGIDNETPLERLTAYYVWREMHGGIENKR